MNLINSSNPSTESKRDCIVQSFKDCKNKHVSFRPLNSCPHKASSIPVPSKHFRFPSDFLLPKILFSFNKSFFHFSMSPHVSLFHNLISFLNDLRFKSQHIPRRPTPIVVSSTNFTLSLPFDFNHIFSNLKELLPLLSHCNQAIYDIVVFGVTSNSTWENVPLI